MDSKVSEIPWFPLLALELGVDRVLSVCVLVNAGNVASTFHIFVFIAVQALQILRCHHLRLF